MVCCKWLPCSRSLPMTILLTVWTCPTVSCTFTRMTLHGDKRTSTASFAFDLSHLILVETSCRYESSNQMKQLYSQNHIICLPRMQDGGCNNSGDLSIIYQTGCRADTTTRGLFIWVNISTSTTVFFRVSLFARRVVPCIQK